MVLTTLISWTGRFIPAVGQWGALIIALLFIYVPIEILERRGYSIKDFGIWRGDWKRGLRQFGWVSLLVFPLYAVCFHHFQTIYEERTARFEVRKLQDWPLEFAPNRINDRMPDGLRVTLKGDLIHFKWNFDNAEKLILRLQGNDNLHQQIGTVRRLQSSNKFEFEASNQGSLLLRTMSTVLYIEANVDGTPIPSELLLDGYDQPVGTETLTLERNWWWFFHFLMGQLLLVALPEEVFYRGYIQSRLEDKFPRKHRFCGTLISWPALFWTSAIFAVGHVLTIPHPARLAVFFPSLLFGWMRSASGSILSAILFHAACNVFAQIAFKFYL